MAPEALEALEALEGPEALAPGALEEPEALVAPEGPEALALGAREALEAQAPKAPAALQSCRLKLSRSRGPSTPLSLVPGAQ